jgi:nucleotide-binding universal stress UspA family protein
MPIDQALDERPASNLAEERATMSPIKSILLHVQSDEDVDSRLDTALALARANAAHLSCLHVTPIEAYVAFDSFGGVFVMNDVIKAIDEEQARLRHRLEERLKNEDVSWDYQEVTGQVASSIVRHAALSDLIIAGRQPHNRDFAGPAVGLLGDLIFRSRTPLFIPADDGRIPDVAGPALIAWDGSYEAANTVRWSLGLLGRASVVRVLRVDEQKDESFPSTRLLEYLSRHGIHAELAMKPPSEGDIAATLLTEARALSAAYLVMGGYNHSRIGQYIFGGVTRSLLASADVALVVAQ